MKASVDQDHQLELNLIRYFQPVQLCEEHRDVVTIRCGRLLSNTFYFVRKKMCTIIWYITW